ncbi:MAG: HAD family hydrolase [Actinomycetota bacterium]|nr:HAD family hydrolase [Actinomycetota bacterium]
MAPVIAAACPHVSVALFDLDDTLFAHRRSVELGLFAHRTAIGGDIAAADRASEYSRWSEIEEVEYHRYLRGELEYHGQRRSRARAFVAPFGIELASDAEADSWFEGYRRQYEASWTLHVDTLACLDALADGPNPPRIGVITNGDIHFQTAKLLGTGLLPRIENVVASSEVGIAKPDAAIFAHACDVFGVEPGDAAYIGDRLATDALGASAAGLLGVWLDRQGAATDEQLETCRAAGVPVIRSLAEVPHLLGR